MTSESTRPYQSHRDSYLPAIRLYTRRASTSRTIARLSRFINTKLYRLGIGSSLNRYDNSLTLYSAKADKALYEGYSEDAIFCNFGSGAFFHHRWKNYDYPGQSAYYKAIQGKQDRDFFAINLCEDNLVLPEASDSVSLIYCSHTLEHLQDAAARHFLKECHRILEPGGVMRIALPNTTRTFELTSLLASQEEASCEMVEAFLTSAAALVLSDAKTDLSLQERVALFERSGGNARAFYELAVEAGLSDKFDGNNPERHITFWDYDEVLKATSEAGFSRCIPLYQGSSVARPFTNILVFDTSEPHITLYADIIK